MESQTELAQPSFKVVKELFRILPVLKFNHEVIRVAHDNRVSIRLLRTPFPVKPEVEDVVQVNICQNWLWEPYSYGNLSRCGRVFSRDWTRIRFP